MCEVARCPPGYAKTRCLTNPMESKEKLSLLVSKKLTLFLSLSPFLLDTRTLFLSLKSLYDPWPLAKLGFPQFHRDSHFQDALQ